MLPVFGEDCCGIQIDAPVEDSHGDRHGRGRSGQEPQRFFHGVGETVEKGHRGFVGQDIGIGTEESRKPFASGDYVEPKPKGTSRQQRHEHGRDPTSLDELDRQNRLGLGIISLAVECLQARLPLNPDRVITGHCKAYLPTTGFKRQIAIGYGVGQIEFRQRPPRRAQSDILDRQRKARCIDIIDEPTQRGEIYLRRKG